MKPSRPWAGPRAVIAQKEAAQAARDKEWQGWNWGSSWGGWGYGSWSGQQ